MDNESITNVIHHSSDFIEALNTAIWLNFKHQALGEGLFSIMDGPNDVFSVVSRDVLEDFENPSVIPHDNHYEGMDPEVAHYIRHHPQPMEHWQEIIDMISSMDGDILRFILYTDIPLNTLIKEELAGRGYDNLGIWIGFEQSKALWTPSLIAKPTKPRSTKQMRYGLGDIVLSEDQQPAKYAQVVDDHGVVLGEVEVYFIEDEEE